MDSERIAIVGIGLTYPDAADTEELWDNVLSGRRAFRTLPEQRMSLQDYYDPDPTAPDKFYSRKAAVLRDWKFDRVAWRVSASTFRSTDMTHWLALETCGRALADAGFPDGDGLPREMTGVILGNTLTGEFSRANNLRLRWPYVRRAVAAELAQDSWPDENIAGFLSALEVRFKSAFPPITEDTLAGGLANTIAGRICNHFDFGGGGFTVDGACSSSLLATVDSSAALLTGDLDVAICGGVDLSIDPFEVTGFAKTGALATSVMKVYDRDSNGFWPGEGCGVLVLMRESDALAQSRRVYALISGWGVSSDGKGGITRPEAEGHRRALRRAYRRAGYSPETVSYIEGHGTGTAVGDATEISALASLREPGSGTAPVALGSVKANIGHTKAAAGAAGLIKAALAVYHQVIPPATGHTTPHPALSEHAESIYVPTQAGLFPSAHPIRAGVSSMGFGGINVHLALESAAPHHLQRIPETVHARVQSRQDAELLLFNAETIGSLRGDVGAARDFCTRASEAELTDLALGQAKATTSASAPYRLAVITNSPDDAVLKLDLASATIDQISEAARGLTRIADGIYFGVGEKGSIGFAFPGQGAGIGRRGAVAARFGIPVQEWPAEESVSTDQAQPRITRACLHALQSLSDLNIEADSAIGHSLGEIAALAWSGAVNADEAVNLATVRGRCMEKLIPKGGAMAAVNVDADTAAELARTHNVHIAGYNGPQLTILAGPETNIVELSAAATATGTAVTRLNVPYAFHTPGCQDAADGFAQEIHDFAFGPPRRQVLSTALGGILSQGTDLADLLKNQITSPVRFLQAASHLVDADLVLEVGPGRTLGGLLRTALPDTVVVSTDTDSHSLAPFLSAVGAAYAAGSPVDLEPLTLGRVHRPISTLQTMHFLASPCESAPALAAEHTAAQHDPPPTAQPQPVSVDVDDLDTVDILRQLLADRVELPVATITGSTSPLDDLHMSSITIGQVVNDALRALNKAPSSGAPTFATSTVDEIAGLLDQLDDAGDSANDRHPGGLGPWVSGFVAEPARTRLRKPPATKPQAQDGWVVIGPASPFSRQLTDTLAAAGVGAGVLAALDQSPLTQRLELIIAMIQAVAGHDKPVPLVVLEPPRHGAAAAAKTVLLEGLATTLTIIHLGPGLADGIGVTGSEFKAVIDSAAADICDVAPFRWVEYPDGTTRHELEFVPRQPEPDLQTHPLGKNDVLYVTGGAKGITAECAIRLATDSGAALALVGRSKADDPAVARTLTRLAENGTRHCYLQTDITDPDDVEASVSEAQTLLGPITGIVHGAGLNRPIRAAELTRKDFSTTLAPKVDGLQHVLSCLHNADIRLLIGFGSIIGRAGLHGEAHYATANAWLADDIASFADSHPQCRASCIEWSVWAGAGMGESLGVLETLRATGIEPIPQDQGVQALTDALQDTTLPAVFVVAGRTGDLPTFPIRRPGLPFLRFLETPRVYYPSLELIVDNELTATTDPYLTDHNLDGDLLFPAVMGLEAIVQAASALEPALTSPQLRDVHFQRPVVVAADGATTLRIVAQRFGDRIDIAVRSSETRFAVDHFTASLTAGADVGAVPDRGHSLDPIWLSPAEELYGTHMFQGTRFQAVSSYRVASARRVVAQLHPSRRTDWFHQYLPSELLLGDPDARDAMMHCLQCCVPDSVLLPEGIDQLVPAPVGAKSDCYRVQAVERHHEGDVYSYDVTAFGPTDEVIEQWLGLKLRAVRRRSPDTFAWSPAFCASFLQRAAEPYLDQSLSVVVEPRQSTDTDDIQGRLTRSNRALARVHEGQLQRLDSGQLTFNDNTHVSTSHNISTLAVVSSKTVGCDTEAVEPRDRQTWDGLLGTAAPLAEQIAADLQEPFDQAATRVWGALECIRKMGYLQGEPTLATDRPAHTAVLTWGTHTILTWVLRLQGAPTPTMFAISGASTK